MPKGQKLKKSGIKKETNNKTTFFEKQKTKKLFFCSFKNLEKKVEANFFLNIPPQFF